MDTRGVSLAQLRARFASADLTPAEIDALRRDGRVGARALASQLERRGTRARRERERLDALFAMERELEARGVARIAGVDEVGMGPLAGPVAAAAVVLPEGARIDGLRDSKQLSPANRERLDCEIRQLAVAVSIGEVDPGEIDRVNIYQAGLLAMRRAVEGLRVVPGQLLIDARRIPGVPIPQRAVVRGDASVGAIAAASVVAKVWRDRSMRELDRTYPGYGFARNAGYATAEHLGALARRGPSPAHRRSFAPVARAAGDPSCHTS